MTQPEGLPGDETAVKVLLLGDPGCGKTTFLSCLKKIPSGPRQAAGTPNASTELLRDSDQPFLYDIHFSRRSFTMEIYDTDYPNQHWSTLRPDLVLIAFDISNRDTLEGLKTWRTDVIRYFQHGQGERIPVMMVGLKRDLRVEDANIIYPQETYRMAQELRCDRYAECSAVTGELMAEAFEDLARLAGMTTTEAGGQTKGGCCVM